MWSNFNVASNEDETVSNGFSTNALFQISSDAASTPSVVCPLQPPPPPRVRAEVQNHKMVLTIDQSLFLIADERHIDRSAFLSFSSPIDAMCVSHSGQLVVCALTDGNVHGVLIDGAVPLFNLCISADDIAAVGTTFVGISQVSGVYFLGCATGRLYRLFNVDEALLSDTVLDGSIGGGGGDGGMETSSGGCNETILNNVQLDRCNGRLYDGGTFGQCFGVLPSFDTHVLENGYEMLFVGRRLVHWSAESGGERVAALPPGVDGFKMLFNLEHFIIGLSTNGRLYNVCPHTLLVWPASQQPPDYLIDDIVVIECNDTAVELLLLTRCDPDSRQRRMLTVDYPSMRVLIDLSVPEHTWLIRQAKSSVNMYYLHGKVDAESVHAIVMNIISETQPAERLKTLIQRGHLDEAQQFADKYGLSLMAVHEAKARRLVVEIGAMQHDGGGGGGGDKPQQQQQLLKSKFDQLLGLAALITDRAFLLSLRHIEIADRAVKRTFLEFLVNNIPSPDDGATDAAELADINEQLRRFDTLALIDPNDCVLQWQQFVRHPRLVELVMQTFKTDMPTACLIWQHHAGSILPLCSNTEDSVTAAVDRILSAIPTATPPFDIILWVRHFVPGVAQCHPAALRTIAAWCGQKTNALQYSPHWPEVGVEFAASIRAVFAECRYLVADVQRQHDVTLAAMDAQLRALHDLHTLQQRYKLTVTLDDYTIDAADDVAARLLGRVALVHLADMARTFLYPQLFARRHWLTLALVRYVRHLVVHRRAIVQWQERAVVLVQQLSGETERLECALLVLRNAPVPWSAVVAPLVAYRTSSHPLASDIASQYELQAIKMLKTKYGWPADSADDSLKLAARMCKLQLPEMFADVRAVHDMEPDPAVRLSVRVMCVLQLVRQRQSERAAEFVDALTADEAATCCESVLDVLGSLLDEEALVAITSGESLATSGNASMEFLMSIRERFTATDRLRHKYGRIQRMHTLRQRFGLPVRMAELSADAAPKCSEYLQLGIERILANAMAVACDVATSPAGPSVLSKCWHDTLALADALCVDRVRAIVMLCDAQHDVQLTCAMAIWVLELCQTDGRNCGHWMDLAALLCAQQIAALDAVATASSSAEASTLPVMSFPLAYRLLQQTVGVDGDVLFDYRELLEWPRVANDAFAVSEVERFVSDASAELEEAVTARMRSSGTAGNTSVKNESVRRDSMSIFEQVTVASTDLGKQPSSSNAEAVVRCVALAMRLFLALGRAEHALFGRMLRFYAIDVDAIEEVENSFVKSLEHLIKSKQHSAAFIAIHQTLRTQKASKHLVLSAAFASMFHKKALRYALSQKEPDFNDALTVLLADHRPHDCLQYLDGELKSGYMKINYLTLVEMHSATLGDTHKFSVSRKTRMKYVYYTELSKSDPSLKARDDLDFTSITSLMRDLTNKRLDVDLLQRMSADFGWDYQHVLVKQILIVLDQQKLEFDLRQPTATSSASVANARLPSTADEIVVRSSAFVDILQTCAPYIDELKCTQLLADELLAYMEAINFYFYEHYLNVIDMLAYVKRSPPQMELWRNVLLFLKHKMRTKRRNRIGQKETDAWMLAQPDVGVMPHIAYYRFPFWTIVKEPLRDSLEDEVFVDNCVEWFPLIRLHADIMQKNHADEQDHFCMSAVKNSMSDHWKLANSSVGANIAAGTTVAGSTAGLPASGEPDAMGWCLEPIYNSFLQSILRLTEHIHKRSRKLFILYFVTNHLPEGADQIDAAHECYRFAVEHAAEFATSAKAQPIVTKIRRKYPMLKTQHLMHVHGLVDERLFQLIEQPRELIEALYGHQAIVGRKPATNINALANEIAELHDLKPRDVQVSILNKWLATRPDAGAGDADETFYEDLNVTLAAGDEKGNIDEDVIKIHYILHSWNPTDAIQWLVSFIFAEDGVETAQQIKAFEVYIKLYGDGDTDTGETYKELFTQDQYLALKCVHMLKQLGFNLSAGKLIEYDKRTLLRKVWQSHADKPLALELIALICHGYAIHNPTIWNGVLKQMVALNMVDKLAVLLDTLSTEPRLLQLDGLVRAWEHVIRAPFRSANRTRSLEQERQLCGGLRRLQACPIFRRVNVVELARTCVRLQRPHMAAVTLAFVGDEEGGGGEVRKEIVALVRGAVGGGGAEANATLKKEITDLEEFGVYPMVTLAAIKAMELI